MDTILSNRRPPVPPYGLLWLSKLPKEEPCDELRIWRFGARRLPYEARVAPICMFFTLAAIEDSTDEESGERDLLCVLILSRLPAIRGEIVLEEFDPFHGDFSTPSFSIMAGIMLAFRIMK